jgi:hypothetical protein
VWCLDCGRLDSIRYENRTLPEYFQGGVNERKCGIVLILCGAMSTHTGTSDCGEEPIGEQDSVWLQPASTRGAGIRRIRGGPGSEEGDAARRSGAKQRVRSGIPRRGQDCAGVRSGRSDH